LTAYTDTYIIRLNPAGGWQSWEIRIASIPPEQRCIRNWLRMWRS